MDGFARLLHPVWQKILQNLGILINPDLKLTLSDLGSIRVPNPWRRHELGIYVTSTKEVQRYVVIIIQFGSIDRPFYLNTWHFHVVITGFDDSNRRPKSNYRSRQLAKLSGSFVWFHCWPYIILAIILFLYFLDVVRFYNFSFLKMNVFFHGSNFILVVSIVLINSLTRTRIIVFRTIRNFFVKIQWNGVKKRNGYK